MGGVFVPDLPILTDRLLLRAFTEDDLDDLHAIQSRPEVTPYIPWDVRTRDEVRVVLKQRLTMDRLTAEGDTILFAAERRDTGRMIGDVNLTWVSEVHRQAEIGFVFHPDEQGRGYARETVAAVLDLALTQVGLHRVFARVDARNTASAGLLRRLGLRQEAHLVQNEFFKGEWSDELIFAVLAQEWAA